MTYLIMFWNNSCITFGLVTGASWLDHVTCLLRDHHWLPVTSCQAAYWVQAVHDCSPLPAWRSTTLSGRPHHAVCCSDCQSRSQIHHVWLCRSVTYHVITRRPLVCCGRSARVEQAAVTTFVALNLLTLSNANWKQFYFPRLFSFWILDFAYC